MSAKEKKPTPRQVTNEAFVCSFCRKPSREVAKMIAGPAVFICNECVELCVAILIEHKVPIVDGAACDAMSRMLKCEEDLGAMRHDHRMAGIKLVGVMHTIAGVLSRLGLKQEDAMQCSWCERPFAAGDEIRNHVATCEKHPAVMRLMGIHGKETA